MELLKFEYKRSDLKPPAEDHPLTSFSDYSDITINQDEEWLHAPLSNMHDIMATHLVKLNDAVTNADTEEIKELRSKFYQAGNLYLEDSVQALQRLEEIADKPMTTDDPGNMLLQEIRQLLRAEPDHRERRKMIQSKLDTNDTTWLKAAANAPDEPVSKEWLKEITRGWSCSKNPQLLLALGDARTILNRKRKRLSELNGAIIGMQMAMGIDPETTVDWEEHFKCFVPRSEKSKQNMLRKIQTQKEIKRARDRFASGQQQEVVNLR